MPLMKVRREDDTGWYTVDHLNFNYIGLGIDEPITLVQAKTKENYNNLNKIYVYDGKDDYPYNDIPKEELLYKSSMLNELQNNWMPKLLEINTRVNENQQKNVEINVSGHPGALLLEHRTVIKTKTTTIPTGGTSSGGTNTNESPKCEYGNIDMTNGTNIKDDEKRSVRTDFFDISTVKKITPMNNNNVRYKIHVYDKSGKYEGMLSSNGDLSSFGGNSDNFLHKGPLSTDSEMWSTNYKYRLSGSLHTGTSIGDPSIFWKFDIATEAEPPEENNNDSSTTVTSEETFHILNYWNGSKWVPLNNIWG